MHTAFCAGRQMGKTLASTKATRNLQHVIALNGPPGSGKDTIARILAEQYHFEHLMIKQPLFDIARTVLGDDFELFMQWYNDRNYKEKPMDLLGGLSPRQFFIRISEEWTKPTMGQGYFGNRAGRSAKAITERVSNWGNPGAGGGKGPRSVVFSDGGFLSEMEAIQQHCPQFRVVRLYRDGFEFGNDSRDYVHGVPGFTVLLEDGKPEQAAEHIFKVLEGQV